MQLCTCRGLLNLCISDTAKQMLLHNSGFIPLLLDGLLLRPDHPRKGTDEQVKAAVQVPYLSKRDFGAILSNATQNPFRMFGKIGSG